MRERSRFAGAPGGMGYTTSNVEPRDLVPDLSASRSACSLTLTAHIVRCTMSMLLLCVARRHVDGPPRRRWLDASTTRLRLRPHGFARAHAGAAHGLRGWRRGLSRRTFSLLTVGCLLPDVLRELFFSQKPPVAFAIDVATQLGVPRYLQLGPRSGWCAASDAAHVARLSPSSRTRHQTWYKLATLSASVRIGRRRPGRPLERRRVWGDNLKVRTSSLEPRPPACFSNHAYLSFSHLSRHITHSLVRSLAQRRSAGDTHVATHDADRRPTDRGRPAHRAR